MRKPLSMGEFSSQPITEFWRRMLSGCQVCNWGIQYHLCSMDCGCLAVVAQWQNTGGSSQKCPGIDSWWTLVKGDLCTLHVGKVLHIHLTMVSLNMETCVGGFHIYKVIWEAAFREGLECGQERSNQVDRYVVAVVKNETVVAHVLWKISRMCSLFWRCGGSITCQVTWARNVWMSSWLTARKERDNLNYLLV